MNVVFQTELRSKTVLLVRGLFNVWFVYSVLSKHLIISSCMESLPSPIPVLKIWEQSSHEHTSWWQVLSNYMLVMLSCLQYQVPGDIQIGTWAPQLGSRHSVIPGLQLSSGTRLLPASSTLWCVPFHFPWLEHLAWTSNTYLIAGALLSHLAPDGSLSIKMNLSLDPKI